jgi:DNA-binding MarR family transcriptional regulator
MGTTLKGVCIPEEILTDSQLGSTQKLVYAVMVMNANSSGICAMNGKEIGERLGVTTSVAVRARWVLSQRGHVRKLFKTNRRYEYEVILPEKDGDSNA